MQDPLQKNREEISNETARKIAVDYLKERERSGRLDGEQMIDPEKFYYLPKRGIRVYPIITADGEPTGYAVTIDLKGNIV